MADKPGEKTTPATPGFPRASVEKRGAASATDRTDRYVKTATGWRREVGQDMGGVTIHQSVAPTESAPVVSQGAWRERAFVPRGVMAREPMLSALADEVNALQGVTAANPSELVDPILEAWLPVLRQAIDQAGGDGLDGWLGPMLKAKPPFKPYSSTLLAQLAQAVETMRASATMEGLVAAAGSVVSAVEAQTQEGQRVSFKVLEKELEGKLEVHELLQIRFATVDQLRGRLEELGESMDTIRSQLKSMPGSKPDGMYSNFARLKAEARVLTAELKRRGA